MTLIIHNCLLIISSRVKFALLLCLLLPAFYGSAQTANIIAGCAPMTVNFTAPGSATTWYWNFMDGASSNLQNPSNTFTTPGTYAVEFRQTTTGPLVGTVTITVFPKPVPQIVPGSLLQGCSPLTVTLQGTATTPPGVNVTAYQWAFGQGSGAFGQNTTFTYTNPGVYDVTLGLITNFPSCNVTRIFDDYISVSNPTANFNTNPNPAFSCTSPLTVSFTNTSVSPIPLTYSWNMGNTNTYTTQNPPPQIYTVDGLYPVTLTITDTNGCVKTVTKNVSIGSPVANFTAPDSVCLNAEVIFTSTSSPGLHQWNFGPGASPATSTSMNPAPVTYSTPGIKNVHLTITSQNGQCSKDTTIAVFVEDPSFTINSDPGYSCQSPVTFDYSITTAANVVEWDWTFGDGEVDSVSGTPSHVYDLPDTTFYRREPRYLTTSLTITTAAGCTFTATIVDTIHPVFARFMPDKVDGCGPLTVLFSDSSLSNEPLVTWHYDYGDGSQATLTSNAPHSHVFNAPGVYPVVLTATNNAGCFDISDTIFIEVGAPVTMDFSASPLSVCPGDSISFTNLVPNADVDAWHFSTDGELLSHCFDDQNPTAAFDDTTGQFSVTLTAIYNGCVSQFTKNDYIEVKGPIAKFNYLYDCSAPLDVQFKNQSMGATSTSWVLGDGNTHTAPGNFAHSYSASGDYQVILTASNASSGCPDSRDTFLVSVRTIQANFSIEDSYCGGASYLFNASPSVDVHTGCYRGYTWMFEDNAIRPVTTENPTAMLSFQTSGEQDISLIVTDINGCKDTLTYEVKVYNLDAVYAMNVASICLPGSVNFNESSTSDTTLVSWNWNFGDGTNSTVQDPSHNYTTGIDSIPVSLTVTDVLGCTDVVTQYVVLYAPLSNIISPGTIANFCAGTPITFNATDFTSMGSNLSFSWDFDDGTSGITANPTTHAYTNAGSYTVELHFEEISSGCEGTVTKVVNIQNYPVANFDGIGTDAFCSPAVIAFTNTSVSAVPLTTQWTFTPGQTTTIANPTFTFTTGNYNAQLIVSTSYGCSDTLARAFSVLGPQGDFILNPQTICRGDDITFTLIDTTDIVGYDWDFGDGLDTTNVSPVVHTYDFIPPSGQTVAKLTLYGDANGSCPVTVEKMVFIREVRALFDRNDELDTVLCLGEPLLLTNHSMNSTVYSWNFGDNGTSASAASSFNHTYTTADTFAISLAVYNPTFGCRDTIIKEVIVHPLPVVTAEGDTICFNSQGQLQAFSPDATINWSWSPVTGLNNPNSANPTSNVGQTTTYTVTGLNTITQCSSTAQAEFTVIQPLDDIYFDTTIVVGDFINLPISNQNGFVVFEWTPETGLSCTDCSNPEVQGLEEMIFTVVMTDLLGCSTANGTFIIKIHPETFIDLPTTFTPNGDGVNDVISVKGWGIKELIYFQIYNRWGELVFESANVDHGWDGYYKGMLQNNGTYTYKVKGTSWRNEELEKNGFINLMR